VWPASPAPAMRRDEYFLAAIIADPGADTVRLIRVGDANYPGSVPGDGREGRARRGRGTAAGCGGSIGRTWLPGPGWDTPFCGQNLFRIALEARSRAKRVSDCLNTSIGQGGPFPPREWASAGQSAADDEQSQQRQQTVCLFSPTFITMPPC